MRHSCGSPSTFATVSVKICESVSLVLASSEIHSRISRIFFASSLGSSPNSSAISSAFMLANTPSPAC